MTVQRSAVVHNIPAACNCTVPSAGFQKSLCSECIISDLASSIMTLSPSTFVVSYKYGEVACPPLSGSYQAPTSLHSIVGQYSEVQRTTLLCTAYFAVKCSSQNCNALHYTSLHCTELHYTAKHCTALHYTAKHCTALHCTAKHCTALHASLHQVMCLNL